MPNPWAGAGGNILQGVNTAINLAQFMEQKRAAARKAQLDEMSLMAQLDAKADKDGPEVANTYAEHIGIPARYRAGDISRGTQGLIEKLPGGAPAATGVRELDQLNEQIVQGTMQLRDPGAYGRNAAAAGTERDKDALRLAGVPYSALAGPGAGAPPTTGADPRAALTPDMASLAGRMGAMPGPVDGVPAEIEALDVQFPLERLMGQMGGSPTLPDDIGQGATYAPADVPLGGGELTDILATPQGASTTVLSDAEAYLLTQTDPADRPKVMQEFNRAREDRLKLGLSARDEKMTEYQRESLELQRERMTERRRRGAGTGRKELEFYEKRRTQLVRDADKLDDNARQLEQRLFPRQVPDKLDSTKTNTVPGLTGPAALAIQQQVAGLRQRAQDMRGTADMYTTDIENALHPPPPPKRFSDADLLEVTERLLADPDPQTRLAAIVAKPKSGLTRKQIEILTNVVKGMTERRTEPEPNPAPARAPARAVRQQYPGEAGDAVMRFEKAFQNAPDREKLTGLLQHVQAGELDWMPADALKKYVDEAKYAAENAGFDEDAIGQARKHVAAQQLARLTSALADKKTVEKQQEQTRKMSR